MLMKTQVSHCIVSVEENNQEVQKVMLLFKCNSHNKILNNLGIT